MSDDEYTTGTSDVRFRTISGVLDRGRLFDVLTATEPRICVVSAPSGFGKTTLLRSWLLAVPAPDPVVWVPLNYAVSSRVGLWERVVAIAARAGVLGDALHGELVNTIRSSSDPVAAIIAVVGESLRFTVVFDAYEHLGDLGASIDADIVRLVRAIPLLRVIVTTRAHTTLAHPTLILDGTSHVIEADRLSFTRAEVAELVAEHSPAGSRAFAAAVHSETRGYPLATRAFLLGEFALRSVGHSAASAHRASGAGDERSGGSPLSALNGSTLHSAGWRTLVAQHLRSQLADLEPERFVIDTSVPPYCDEELAGALTGRADKTTELRGEQETLAATFDRLERLGFGRWIPFALERPVFQYVEVIRELFVADLRATNPVRYRRALSLSARWLFDNDDNELALKLAIEATDYALSAEITEHLIVSSPASYTTDRLADSLALVPRPMLGKFPVLAFALGLALQATPLTRESARELFQITAGSAAHGQSGGSPHDVLFRHGLRIVSLRLSGRFAESAEAAHLALGFLDELTDGERQSLGQLLPLALRQLAYSLFQAGQVTQSAAAVEKAVTAVRSQTFANYTLVYAVGIHGITGDGPRTRAAQAAVKRTPLPRDLERNYMDILGRVGEGHQLLDRFDFAGATEAVAGATAHTAEFWPVVTSVTMHARLGLGHVSAELHRVTSLLTATPPPPGTGDNFGTVLVHNGLAILNLAAGRHSSAAVILERYRAADPHIAPARLLSLLLSDRSDAILRILATILESPDHTYRSRSATLTIGAAAALQRGNSELAANLLEQASVLWEHFGTRSQLLYVPAADLCGLRTLSAETGVGTEYLAIEFQPVDYQRLAVGHLSDRERVVLRTLAHTASRHEVAERLFVSDDTVKAQLRSIYRKLGVNNRDQAIQRALELNLLDT